MDTPSPSTASTTAHAVGYNDEPSITAAPLRSTDDLAVDAGQLSSLILTTEATATPQRIVESVTSLTSSGILAEGQRMPTVRDLARLLRTSPATVSSAYHALARSGILRSRGRAGTFVLRQSRTHRYDAGDLLAEAPATAPDRPIIDLSKGTPDLSLLPDIRPFLGKLGTHKAFVNSYDGPTILPMLEQILRRNWPYEPEAMTMASGAGDGLAHTMNAFVQPGDFVITEAPEYPLILDMIEAHGAMAFGVPMDGFGMLPDALDRALTMLESQRLAVPHGGHQVSMILLQPRAQNPTGASFSPQRIDALADVLLAHYPNGVGMPLIVEDDHSGDVANAYATSLAQRLPQHVVHIRSFSKSHGPDLRLAALSGPEDAVEAIIAQRRLGSGWVSRFLQEILYEMLADKEAFHTVTNARHIYATRQKTMHALLLRQSLDVHTGDGLNLWIPVPAYQRRRHRSRRGGRCGRGRACQSRHPRHHRTAGSRQRTSGRRPGSGGGRNAEDFDESLVILHELRSYARRGAAPSVRGDQRAAAHAQRAAQVAGARRPGRRAGLPHRRPDQSAYQLPTPEKVAQEKPRCSRSTTASRRSSSYATWSNPSATSTASSR